MSPSKLESLPNEILIDTLEKYVNGVDILATLAHRLNSRFDALIAQCQQLRFNFIRCQKNKFRLCLEVFPAYYDKITELALSDKDAPGQIYDFLRLFPSFAPFKSLRTLNFCCCNYVGKGATITNALLSLSSTRIETLSIKMRYSANFPSLDKFISTFMNISTLKRLFLVFTNPPSSYWEFPTSTKSNIEYVTIVGMEWNSYGLQCIFKCAPRLKCIKLLDFFSKTPRLRFNPAPSDKFHFTLLPMLHTFIFKLANNDLMSLDTLAKCFNAMPNLHRLEINVDNMLFNPLAWEIQLSSSLPNLTYFTLIINRPFVNGVLDINPYHILETFQTSFWIEKKNFNIIILAKHLPSFYRKNIDDARGSWNHQYDTYDSSTLQFPTFKYWVGPQRAADDDIHTMDGMTRIGFSHLSNLVSHRYYFRNVKFLVFDNLNDTLLEWLTMNVDSTRISELALSISAKQSHMIAPLMDFITNINSLQTNFDQLIAYQAAFRQHNNHLKCLDISDEQHPFKEEDIIRIVQIVPNIEHLIINTADLYNLPLLNFHLPKLHSLTFRVVERYFNRLYDFEQNQSDSQTQHKIEFSFRRSSNWFTIWIDQTAFDESFWHAFKK